MNKKIILTLFVLFIVQIIQAQNNTIFYGGVGDGYSVGSYTQSTPNISLGGDGDGYSVGSYAQITSNINLGGEGDGYAVASYQQLADATLFLGGDGDGWSTANYQQLADANLFLGGDGDGWASVIYPLGPLPVELLSFTGKEVNNEHVLDWKTVTEINTSHFVIEHSTDAKLFRELGMNTAAGNSNAELAYTFTNKKPVLGNNFYRLKMVDIDGKFKYSNIVLLTSVGNQDIVLYPNPASTQLNIDFIGEIDNSIMNLQIIDLNGKTIIRQQLAKNKASHQIDIATLSNGYYQLIIVNKEQRFVLKFNKIQ